MGESVGRWAWMGTREPSLGLVNGDSDQRLGLLRAGTLVGVTL